jgi:hypothetical protein
MFNPFGVVRLGCGIDGGRMNPSSGGGKDELQERMNPSSGGGKAVLQEGMNPS